MNYYQQYQEVKLVMKELNTLDNEAMLDRCFKIAETVHAGQHRQSKEPYIIHPIQVAKILANLHFTVDVVCAALLHDVLEDGEGEHAYSKEQLAFMTNSHIADLVEAVTNLKRDADHQELSKKELDEASLKKFLAQASLYPEAYYVKLSDRLHNLETLNHMHPVKRVNKVRETRRLLLPIAKEMKAHYFVSRFESLCFKYENPDMYHKLDSIYQSSIEYNQPYIDEFEKMLLQLSTEPCDESLIDFHPSLTIQEIFPGYFKYERNLSKVYQSVVEITSNISTIRFNFTELNIPIMNYVLFINEKCSEDRIHMFFKLYEQYFHKKGFLWLKHGIDEHNRLYVLLKDAYKNVYKTILQTPAEVHISQVGSPSNLRKRGVQDVDEYFQKKIQIYRRDGSKTDLEKGATALDFAFKIHTEIGINAQYAIINGFVPETEDQKKESLYQVLHSGDHVIIAFDDKEHAQMEWFLHVYTKEALKTLIKYFNKNEQI